MSDTSKRDSRPASWKQPSFVPCRYICERLNCPVMDLVVNYRLLSELTNRAALCPVCQKPMRKEPKR